MKKIVFFYLVFIFHSNLNGQGITATKFEFKIFTQEDSGFVYVFQSPYLVRESKFFINFSSGYQIKKDSVLMNDEKFWLLKNYIYQNWKNVKDHHVQCRARALVWASVEWLDETTVIDQVYYPCRVKFIPPEFSKFQFFLDGLFK